MMRVADIRRIAALAKRAGAVTVVDNTFLTPYFQRPLELGADITLYSATKFLCGHHDTSAGLLVTSDASLAERLALISRTEGAALSPFDAFLIQRGMKTLALRMEKHQQNACAVTAFLKTQPAVAEVFYPGDEDSRTTPSRAASRPASAGCVVHAPHTRTGARAARAGKADQIRRIARRHRRPHYIPAHADARVHARAAAREAGDHRPAGAPVCGN